MAEKNLWNDGWEFTERALEDMEKQLPHIREIPAEQWRTVELPHDWLISDTTALYRNSIGWYRKRYVIQKAENMEYLLRFDGVYMDSTVYCNGEKVMECKYGYSMFEADLTPFIRDGENEVYVRMVYQAPNSRWYSGAGIYRDVWLKERQATHLVSDGIYITPERNADESWKVKNCTEI